MKRLIVVLSLLSVNSFAQSDCIARRSATNFAPDIPATCTSKLSASVNHQYYLQSQGRVFTAAVDTIPFVNLARTYLVERFEIPEFYTSETDTTLRQYLNEYVDNIDYNRTSSSGSTEKIFEASVTYYMELNKLLENPKFNSEQRQVIQSKMVQLKFMSERALLDLNNKKDSDINKRIEKIEKDLIEKVGKIEYQKLVGKVNQNIEKLNAIESKITELNKSPQKNAEKIAELNQEYKKLKEELKLEEKVTIQDIRNYTQFAQGMVAIYSLFNPQDAARLNAAVSGLSNIAVGVHKLMSAESLTAGAAMGPWGMVAMGAVQVLGSMNKGGGSEAAFKAIFKQLQMISKQIENLNKRMDRLDETLFQLERTILKEFDRVLSRVDSLTDLVEQSNKALEKIDHRLQELTTFVIDESIESRIQNRYNDVIQECLGIKTVTVDLKKDGLTSCLDKFNNWIDTSITSNLLTRKIVSAQYQTRDNFAFQINDLLSDYKRNYKDLEIETLANPILLQDTSDTLNILKLKYGKKLFHKSALNHPVYDARDRLEKDVKNFQLKLRESPEYIENLKKRHLKSLSAIQEDIQFKKDELDRNSSLGFHQKRLDAFVKGLEIEINKRGEIKKAADNDSSYDKIVLMDQKKTLETLKKYHEKLKGFKYRGDLLSLIKRDEIFYFIENCTATNSISTMIPLPKSFLEEKLGNEIATRILLAPESAKICYNLDLNKNVTLFRYRFGFSQNNNFKNEERSIEKDVAVNYRLGRVLIDTNFGGGRRLIDGFVAGTYNGDFLNSITIDGYLDGEKILSEKRTLPKRAKLAWRNGATDPFSLLTFADGNSYHETYPDFIERRQIEINSETRGVVRDCSFNQGTNCLDIFSSSVTKDKDVLNARTAARNRDQKQTLEQQILAGKADTAAKLSKFIENIDTEELDETGRLITLAIYFRDPKSFAGDSKTQALLSEVWGLRSGIFLKKLYHDAIKSDPSTEMLDLVFKDQTTALESIK